MCRLLNLEIRVKSDEINYNEEKFFSNEQELIEDYLCTLYRNGQIFSDYNLVNIEQHKYQAFVNVPNLESLSEKYNNEYVNRSYKHLVVQIKEIGKNILYNPNCSCEDVPYYILYGTSEIGTSSPVICGKCGNDIPLYKVPYLFTDEEHFTLINYQKTYASVHELYMQSLSDRFTKNQLLKPNSSLNKRAFKIREELENKIKKPVYLSLSRVFFDHKNDYKKIDSDKCPKCGKNLEECEYQFDSVKIFKCDDCRLITDKLN